MSAAYHLIATAIREKKAISATYNGLYREMCPHTLGYKKGEERALCYQFGGDSKSGLKPDGSGENWRCVAVAQLQNVQIMEGAQWHTAPNHSRPQSCVDDVRVEVAFD